MTEAKGARDGNDTRRRHAQSEINSFGWKLCWQFERRVAILAIADFIINSSSAKALESDR